MFKKCKCRHLPFSMENIFLKTLLPYKNPENWGVIFGSVCALMNSVENLNTERD
jgi:hypothetical protein